MSSSHLDPLFPSLPTSDLDELDFNAMLAAPSPRPYFINSTPGSSPRSHRSSVSSSSTYLTREPDMSFHNDHDAAQGLYFSSANTAYFPAAVSDVPQMMSYDSVDAYSNWNQQQWMGLPLFTQQTLDSQYSEPPPSSVFPAFETPIMPSGGNLLPPTPRSTASPFASNSSTSHSHRRHLSNPRPYSHSHSSYHSHRTSISPDSRSCSPNPQYATSAPSKSSYSSPSNASSSSSSLHAYGVPVHQPGGSQTWRCAYPGCTSRALFTRGCDLRKHFNRHSKHLFCRVDGCPQSEPRASHDGSGRSGSISGSGGFSSKKDRARHEAKHNPGIRCEWKGSDGEECDRLFSRVDNMKDHVRRIHRKGGSRS